MRVILRHINGIHKTMYDVSKQYAAYLLNRFTLYLKINYGLAFTMLNQNIWNPILSYGSSDNPISTANCSAYKAQPSV